MGKHASKQALLGLCFIILLTLFAHLTWAQASPHNIAGRIFNNDSGTGVPNGVIVWAFDNVTQTFAQTQVSAPPLPQFMGSYSMTISGFDDDFVVMAAYNATHYGFGNVTLLPTTTFYNITLNYTRGSEPNTTILTPLTGAILNTSDPFNVTANVSVRYMSGTGCNVTLSFSTSAANITSDQNFSNYLGDVSLGTHVLTTWNVSGIREGKTNITVSTRCASDAFYLYRSQEDTAEITIRDTTMPIVHIISPLNASWNLANISFIYNVTENTGLLNCSLYFDEAYNQSELNVPIGTPVNFTLNNTPEGEHSWKVSCIDTGFSNLGGNSSSYRLFVDYTSPIITLLSPFNGSSMEEYALFFRYNVTDNFNATNCSLSLNTDTVQTNHSISLNISNNFTQSAPGGNYNWSVNCSDNSGNIGASAYFSIFSADLKISAADIIATTQFPVAKQTITINATIFNLGLANHTRNATVQFIEHNLFDGTEKFLANFSANITSGANITLNLSYLAKAGDFAIVVKVDIPLLANGSVIETIESNNIANITISIPSYHVFYGDVIADILLSTSSSGQVFAWLNATSTGGNLYAADSDSSISFDTLLPLGRNASYNITFDDFFDLDLALNTSNLTTSINRTYTSLGWANYTTNFTLFENFITNVPIINSTNSSQFITGILWDGADSSSGNYTGLEDVVFVTRINRRTSGFYGEYDYELKLPATLENYVQGGTQSSVSFYREIT